MLRDAGNFTAPSNNGDEISCKFNFQTFFSCLATGFFIILLRLNNNKGNKRNKTDF